MRRIRTATCAVAALAAGWIGAPAAHAAPAGDVSLVASSDNPRVLTLRLASRALARTVTSTVYLPDSYGAGGAPSPVVYALHGTVVPGLDNPALTPATSEDLFLHEIGHGGGSFQNDLFAFPATAARAHYVVVAPDTDPSVTVCRNCLWVDGRGPTAVEAESFLLAELVPAVQESLNVRRDRAGRAILGFSMGGVSALLYGFRHPDLFGFVGAVSPAAEVVRDPAILAIQLAVGYFRDQGYGDPLTDPIDNSRFDPVDIAANAAGTGERIVFSTGDGCVSPTDASDPVCAAHPAATNAAASALEVALRRDMETYGLPRFRTLGLPCVELTVLGVHGADNAAVYASGYVDRLNDTFAHPPAPPAGISYLTADRGADAWGYSLDHPGAAGEGFAALRDAGLDGRTFSVAAQGPIAVTTPPRFTPGMTYAVTVTAPGSGSSVRSVIADPEGRLTLQLTPVPAHPQPLDAAAAQTAPATQVTVEVPR